MSHAIFEIYLYHHCQQGFFRAWPSDLMACSDAHVDEETGARV